MVDINWTIFWEVFNFLVLMGLLIKFLYKPVTEMLDKRSGMIKEDLTRAEKNREEAAELKKKYENKLAEARSQAQKIVEEAEKRGKERAKEIVEEAKREAGIIRERNQKEVARAKEEARGEIRDELTGLSLMVTGKFIKEKLEEKEHHQLIEEYIDRLENTGFGEAR